MTEKIQRCDIPTKATILDTFRAFRAYVERVSAAKGETLDPAWYWDSPEETPELYADQPEVLTAIKRNHDTE